MPSTLESLVVDIVAGENPCQPVTDTVLAIRLQVSRDSIRDARKTLGIKSSFQRRRPVLSRDQLIELYDVRGLTQREIAKETSVPFSTVRNLMKSYELLPRTGGHRPGWKPSELTTQRRSESTKRRWREGRYKRRVFTSSHREHIKQAQANKKEKQEKGLIRKGGPLITRRLVAAKCRQCKQRFTYRENKNQPRAGFCSWRCNNIYQMALKYPPFVDAAILRTLYVTERLSCNEIGLLFGVNGTTVYNYLRRYEISTRTVGGNGREPTRPLLIMICPGCNTPFEYRETTRQRVACSRRCASLIRERRVRGRDGTDGATASEAA